TVVEGTITKWLKQEGESVDRDEPLFEISTDKVDTEVPSPVAGKVVQIKVPQGETVQVGTELALIETDGQAAAPTKKEEAATAETAEAPRRNILSPLVRRLAEEHQVDLAHVQGTGTGGRITKKDIQGFIETQGERPQPQPEPLPRPEPPPGPMPQPQPIPQP